MAIFVLRLHKAPKPLLKDKPVARIAVPVIDVVGYIVGCAVLYVVLKHMTWSDPRDCGILTVVRWFCPSGKVHRVHKGTL
jgi:hypothetical protein